MSVVPDKSPSNGRMRCTDLADLPDCRPEFYATLGISWVNNNGPGPAMMEKGSPNGHAQPVSPMKRTLMRNIPEATPELENVVKRLIHGREIEVSPTVWYGSRVPEPSPMTPLRINETRDRQDAVRK